MTNRTVDGFDWLPAVDPGKETMLRLMGAAGYYAYGEMGLGFDSAGTVYPVAGRFGFGRALQLYRSQQSVNQSGFLKPVQGLLTEGRHGFAFLQPSEGNTTDDEPGATGGAALFTVWDGANNQAKFSIGFIPNGAIRVWRGLPIISTFSGPLNDLSNVILTTEAGVYLEDVWQYPDVSWGIGTTDGYIKVRINTKTVIDLVDINNNTASTPITSTFDAYGYAATNGYFGTLYFNVDDTYFNDVDGTENDDVLGNVRVKSQLTLSNGSNIDFTVGGTDPYWILGDKYETQSGDSGNTQNAVFVFPVTADVSGTLAEVRVQCTESSSNKIKAVLYADSGGSPGALIASGTEVIGVAANVVSSFPFGSPPALTSGTDYWIGIMFDNASLPNWVTTADSTSYIKTNTYASGAPDPYGVGSLTRTLWGYGVYAETVDNWNAVQNFEEDDTKYILSVTVNDYDLYNMDPNLNSPLVHVLQVRMVAKQDDSTQRILSAKLKISGVEYDNSGGYYLDQTYSHATVRWELNPATGVSFTGAEVNGLEAGPWFKA